MPEGRVVSETIPAKEVFAHIELRLSKKEVMIIRWLAGLAFNVAELNTALAKALHCGEAGIAADVAGLRRCTSALLTEANCAVPTCSTEVEVIP